MVALASSLDGGSRGGGANPFAGTDLAEKYASAPRSRPGPLALSKTGPTEPPR